MDRPPERPGRLFSGASDIPWSALAAELRRLGFVVEQSKGKATHWIVYYPGRPDTPMQTVVVDRGVVRKPIPIYVKKFSEDGFQPCGGG